MNKHHNDGCALEILLDGLWLPAPIRYRRIVAAEQRALDRGETILQAEISLQRHDWAERQALARALKW